MILVGVPSAPNEEMLDEVRDFLLKESEVELEAVLRDLCSNSVGMDIGYDVVAALADVLEVQELLTKQPANFRKHFER